MYCASPGNLLIPDAMPTLAAIEVLMADCWIVVHPRRMSRCDVNDRCPLQLSSNKIDSSAISPLRFSRSCSCSFHSTQKKDVYNFLLLLSTRRLYNR